MPGSALPHVNLCPWQAKPVGDSTGPYMTEQWAGTCGSHRPVQVRTVGRYGWEQAEGRCRGATHGRPEHVDPEPYRSEHVDPEPYRSKHIEEQTVNARTGYPVNP